eukprot:gene9626-9786_t
MKYLVGPTALVLCVLLAGSSLCPLVKAQDAVVAEANVPPLDEAAVAAASVTILPTSGSTDAQVLASIAPPPQAVTAPVATIITAAHTDAVLLNPPRPISKRVAARVAARARAAEQQAQASKPVKAKAMNPQFTTILSKHNTYRSKHQAGPLQWSDYQASRAAEYASRCTWGHDSNAQAGENLYASSSKSDPTGALTAAIEAWYAEVNSYNFASGGFSGATGHFTQVVWKGTTNIGCAVQDDASVMLFQNDAPIWTSNTQGRSMARPFRLIMQRDGNLIALDTAGAQVWATNTAGQGTGPGYKVSVLNNGNVVLYDALNVPLWATNTCCR